MHGADHPAAVGLAADRHQAADRAARTVDLLRQRELTLPTEAMFQTGDSVVIADGPFAGIEAIFQTADDAGCAGGALVAQG